MSMEIRQPEKAKGIQLARALGVREEDCVSVVDQENGILNVSFDRHKLQVPQILAAVMEQMEIKDVRIQETELAQIVKEIYNHGIGEEKS